MTTPFLTARVSSSNGTSMRSPGLAYRENVGSKKEIDFFIEHCTIFGRKNGRSVEDCRHI